MIKVHLMPKEESDVIRLFTPLPILDTKEKRKTKKERKKEREKVRAFEILADSIGEWNYFGRFLP